MNRWMRCFGALCISLVVASAFWAQQEPRAASMPARMYAGPRPAEWAQPLEPRYNLYRMDAGLYRSALPDARVRLRERGIGTVINFYQRSDADWLRDPDIRRVHLPLRTDRIDDVDVIAALRSIDQAQRHGAVLMHCKHGQNRTGLIAAMYRMVRQGWSREQALLEMREGGFGGVERMGDAEAYLRRVNVEAIRQALDSGACSPRPLALCTVAGWLRQGADRLFGGMPGALHSG